MFKGNVNLAVGIFFATALLGVAGFSMWLAGSKGSQATSSYSVLFEKDVSGLSLGGPVYFFGVNVGNVSEINVIPGEQIKVQVDIAILSDTPVNAGSYASLNGQGITGVTVINISGDPGDHGQIQKTEGFKYPLIPVRQTGLSALLASAPDVVARINKVLDQANLLLGEENRQALTQILLHIESLTSALAEERESFAALPGGINSLVADARSTLAQVSGVITDIEPDLAATLSNLNVASDSLAAILGRVDRWLKENEPEFQHFIDNGLGQVPELIFDLRSTLRDVQKLLQQLQEDPSQLLHRPPDDALEAKP